MNCVLIQKSVTIYKIKTIEPKEKTFRVNQL